MTTKSRRIGTGAETGLVKYLAAEYRAGTERRVLRGAADAGDVADPRVCWQSKAGEQAQDPSDLVISRWMHDVEQQRRNAGAELGVLVLRRKGHPRPAEWWAYVTGGDLAELVRGGRVWQAGTEPTFPVRLRLDALVTLLRRAGYGDPL